MSSSAPLVSIFLPTYSRCKDGYLERAIRSVLLQTYQNYELLIVDDGSIDGSKELIEEYCRKDGRLFHIRNEPNTGLPAYNAGMAFLQSKGEYLAWVFDDCELRPEHLSTLAGILKSKPDVGMVYGKALSHWSDDREVVFGMPYNEAEMSVGNNHIPNVSVMVRRSVIEDVGWYDPHVILKRFCDWDLWTRIQRKYGVTFIDQILADEYGTGLEDSLGQTHTIFQGLLLKYASTERDEVLRPHSFRSYDPFRTDNVGPLDDAERAELSYLLLEHYVKTLDVLNIVKTMAHAPLNDEHERLLHDTIREKAGAGVPPEMKLLMMGLVAYYEKKLALLKREKGEIQGALLSFVHRKEEQETLRDEMARLQHVADDRLSMLTSIMNSTSWRVTAPLRRLGGWGRSMARKMRASVIKPIEESKPVFPVRSAQKRGGSPIKVMAVGDGRIPSIEIGIIRPFDYLQQQGLISYEFKVLGDARPSDCQGADIMFFMRLCSTDALMLLSAARSYNRKIVYAIDDDFEAIDPATSLGRRYREMNAWENVKAFCQAADRVLVFSHGLYEKLKPYNARTAIMPALSNIEVISPLVEKARDSGAHPEIRIGYAGTKTHQQDLEMIAPALRAILQEHGSDIIFEIICSEPEGLDGLENVKKYPCQDGILKFYNLLAERRWDLALAPLVDTPFNRAKSDNKYREYSAFGIPAVYSKVPSYEHSVIHGHTGLLVENVHDQWYDAIKSLINNKIERERISHNASQDVRARYSMAAVTRSYMDIFSSLLPQWNILVCGPINLPTVQIDIIQPYDVLKKAGTLDYVVKEAGLIHEAYLSAYDCLVMVRAAEQRDLALVRKAKSAGLKVIYTWDDNFFEIPKVGEIGRYYHRWDIRGALQDLLREADLVKASTRYLADVSRRFNDQVFVAPYSFDLSLLPDDTGGKDTGRIVIGYFGTPGRDSQFQFVLDALKLISQEYAAVDCEFFGFIPQKVHQLPRVTAKIPLMSSYKDAIRTLASRHWDIGLAPLAVNSFNLAKLPTKYRDYGACQIAGVYTNIETYTDVVTDGRNGLIADNSTEAWYQAIKRLIDDPTLRRRVADAAYTDISTNMTVEKAAEDWKQVLTKVFNNCAG